MKALRLGLANSPPERAAARSLEATVFGRWFGNSAEDLSAIYDANDSLTHFLVVRDASDTVVGAMRVIGGAFEANRTLTDLRQHPWMADVDNVCRLAQLDGDSTWDVATVAVVETPPENARSEVSRALYHGLFTLSLMSGVRAWTSMLDDRVLRILRSLGICFDLLPGLHSAPYLGSPSTSPVYAHLATLAPSVARQRPDAYDQLVRGVGYAHVEIPRSLDWCGGVQLADEVSV
jgi:hypothetical protein